MMGHVITPRGASMPASKSTRTSTTNQPASKSPRKPAAKAAAARAPRAQDATALLRADHKKVDELFKDFEKSRSSARKAMLAQQICLELTVHTQIEEEIFYPALAEALRDKKLVPEAIVEHQSIKDLIAQVKDGSPEDEMYDAKVHVMSEWVKHHVKEEHTEMFPKARKTRLDLKALGAEMAERKAQLMAEGSTELPTRSRSAASRLGNGAAHAMR
jgi:hypothetical protein